MPFSVSGAGIYGHHAIQRKSLVYARNVKVRTGTYLEKSNYPALRILGGGSPVVVLTINAANWLMSLGGFLFIS